MTLMAIFDVEAPVSWITECAPTLDPLTPLATQLHILNLFGGDETPYESLHAVVSSGIKPWFDAFVDTCGGRKDGDSKMGEYLASIALLS